MPVSSAANYPGVTPKVVPNHSDPARVDADALLVPIAQGASSEPVLLSASGGFTVEDLLRLGATGEHGEVTKFPSTGVRAPVIVAVGLGSHDAAITPAMLRFAAGAAARRLTGYSRVAVALVGKDGTPDHIRATVEGLILGAYSFDDFRSKKSAGHRSVAVERYDIMVSRRVEALRAIEAGVATAAAVTLCRDLANMPALSLGPQEFVDIATSLATANGVSTTVLNDAILRDNGYGGLVGVGMGSVRGPRLLRLEWAPRDALETVSLVGKGIVFDSGGLSLKQPEKMETMKYDMSGAAAVLSTVLAASALRIPVKLVGWCALAENLPSGSSLRPGDVINLYDGSTVEVINTDAEGRLVLADALARAAEEKPVLLLDVATLTGAAVTALGRTTMAVLGDDAACTEVLEAAAFTDETAWRLPLSPALRPDLDSDIADMRNSAPNGGGSNGGGTIVASLFLREFVPTSTQWCHIDIAGPGWNSGPPAGHISVGGTGVSVRTLIRLLEDRGSRTQS